MAKKSPDLILALDQGTTGSTAMIVDHKLQVLGESSVDFQQHFPKSGWVEHDLHQVWDSVCKSIKLALAKAKVDSYRIASIGITNQRETTCFWSRKSGKPLSRAIVWQDRRTSTFCESLKSQGLEPTISNKTGLLLDPYFSGTKIHWAIENVAAIKKAAAIGDLCIGTIDSFLIWKLTNGQTHATEPSNASRTLLFNIETLQWDTQLLELMKTPKDALPRVLKSVDHFGETKGLSILRDGIPITGVLGDQQSALLGQACVKEGLAKCTYGTGSFILLNTGSQIRRSRHRQLSTIAWQIGDQTTYALEGGAFTAGAAVQWARDGLGIIKKSEDIEKLALQAKSSEGVVFVPALTGIGAPHWSANSRAAFYGISRGTTKAHIARAILEGIALMNAEILHAMEKDLGTPLKGLNVDGGASRNNLLMQYQSDLLNLPLTRPRMIETTAMGAVFAAGMGIGFWSGLDQIQKSWKCDKIFKPRMNTELRSVILKRWESAIAATKLMATV